MKTRLARVAIPRLALLALSGLTPFAACSLDVDVGSVPQDATTVSDGQPTDAADGLETSTPNDGEAGDLDSGCGVGSAQRGDWVTLLVVTGGPYPSGDGGTIVPGTYVLSALRSYVSTGTAEARETIVVKGSPSVGTLARLSEVRNTSGAFQSHAPLAEFFNWQVQNPSFFFGNPTCPAGGSNIWGAGRYTATPTTLVLSGQGLEYEYTKVP